MDDSKYREAIEKWRAKMDASLRAEDGWLALAGLFWLHKGENTFGVDASNDILLPPGSAATRVGSFEFHNGVTTLHAANSNHVTVNGASVTDMRLQSDEDGTQAPTVVKLDGLMMAVIKRGDRHAIRIWDKNNPVRQAFKGRQWYPIDESYRIEALFVPYAPPRQVTIMNVLGFEEDRVSPGYVAFQLHGQESRLEAFTASHDRLFFVLRDATSGDTTYGAARFLYANAPHAGKVILDFNKAYSPPCAFSLYTTCPMPPRQNWLTQRIEAGEKKPKD